jgi:hypothetical protein
VDIAYEVSAKGGALETVATACKTPLSTVKLWMQRAREGKGSDLDNAFLTAIQEGRHKAEIRAIGIVTGSEDPRDAQWWLTHHPRTRDTWSDAAAERRAIQRTLTGVVAAIDAAGLADEQRTRLLLTLQAQGLGVQADAGS